MQSSSFIIVGSGMAGLVAAWRLLERGHKVLVLEQADRAGGYFGGFTNAAGDRFDLAVSHLLGGLPGDNLSTLISSLGLDDQVSFEAVDIADVMTIKGRRVELPTGFDRLEQSLGEQFPDSGPDIHIFFQFMRAFLGEGNGDSREKGRFMMRNYRREFEAFCAETIVDPVLRSALAMRIQCDDSSLMIMAGFITECYAKGMVYPKGGVHKLIDAIVERIRQVGGTVEFGAKVTDFIILDARVDSVVLADGSVRTADVILYNGDAPTLSRTLEARGHPGIDDECRRRGHSSLSIFLTLLDADLSRFAGVARFYLTETDDVFETYRVLETGVLPENPVIKLHFMSRIDDGLSVDGRDLIRVEVDMYHDSAVHDEDFYADYARQIETIIAHDLVPEIDTHVVYRRVVTPIDYERWFGHTGGSATGWAHDVNNYMIHRMNQRTSIENLFITGQWGEHGSGLPQLIASADKSVTLAEQWLRKRAAA
ncbi:NAD(P)/FAD-dependent oxidoreductase [Cryobacterium sp. TMS1-13-1]|uniref:phytoene desaturase family protein n=1 Tax=Cryobacterium sp. TMS1-13-1 TaxID=1259220 RepID=UPI00106BE3AB|nr:NAD(P)/FAD-dependent oxidoreductase [Cryobacterium sp. TMS1-13-1]TFD19191.1 NAD(P)/FAD-dependent oxidoreductase [Cryobacterium sp. TMS1-13-1]